MPWAYVQLATKGNWETYEKVSKELDPPSPSEGLLFHAAGANAEEKWRVIQAWDSEEAFTRFRDARLMPTLLRVLGEEHMAQGPPPIEAFDVREMYAK